MHKYLFEVAPMFSVNLYDWLRACPALVGVCRPHQMILISSGNELSTTTLQNTWWGKWIGNMTITFWEWSVNSCGNADSLQCADTCNDTTLGMPMLWSWSSKTQELLANRKAVLVFPRNLETLEVMFDIIMSIVCFNIIKRKVQWLLTWKLAWYWNDQLNSLANYKLIR